MRRNRAIRTRLAVGVTSLGLILTGSAVFGTSPSGAVGNCGGSADDVLGTFTAQRPPAGPMEQGLDQPLTVTFRSPNQVSTDYQARKGGAMQVQLQGSGTFTVQPLGWTEKGTAAGGGKSTPYTMTFAASKVECASDTRVSSFTGEFISSGTPKKDIETFTRTQ